MIPLITVCCKEELAPSISASVRNVEDVCYLFFPLRGQQEPSAGGWPSAECPVESMVINQNHCHGCCV